MKPRRESIHVIIERRIAADFPPEKPGTQETQTFSQTVNEHIDSLFAYCFVLQTVPLPHQMKHWKQINCVSPPPPRNAIIYIEYKCHQLSEL